MFHKIPGLAAVVVAFLILGVGLGGCVAKSDYLRKQAEADALNRDLATLTTENQESPREQRASRKHQWASGENQRS